MNVRGQRALVRRNRRETDVVQEGPREEEIVESDTEEDSGGARCFTFTYLHTRCSGSTSSSSHSGSNPSWNVIIHG